MNGDLIPGELVELHELAELGNLATERGVVLGNDRDMTTFVTATAASIAIFLQYMPGRDGPDFFGSLKWTKILLDTGEFNPTGALGGRSGFLNNCRLEAVMINGDRVWFRTGTWKKATRS
jgi:hypothetical protein